MFPTLMSCQGFLVFVVFTSPTLGEQAHSIQGYNFSITNLKPSARIGGNFR